jgi:sulfur-oxidizing protein SoxZ
MAEAKPRIKVPAEAKAGEIITIKTLLSHKMESGQRKNDKGEVVPRQIINAFSAKFNGEEFFGMVLEPAISANPYFEFAFKAEASGEFEFIWTDDDGTATTAKSTLKVA